MAHFEYQSNILRHTDDRPTETVIPFKDSFKLRTVPTIVIACAYFLHISRYSDSLSPMLTNTGIFLRGLKLSGESRS